jgi:hypothetical protein
MQPADKNALTALLVLQPLLFAVPLAVLGGAIGWPASLRLPPGEALPLIHANAGAVQLGYWAYLLVSAAMVPLAYATKAWCAARGQAGWRYEALAFAGAAAGVLKMLGIVRWLAAMPALAAHYAVADGPTQATLAVVYSALNAYAGAVGELLGVQLASGLWFAGTGAALMAAGLRWTGAAGTAVGALFVATCLRTVLPEAAAIQSLAVPAALLWFVAAAVAMRRA